MFELPGLRRICILSAGLPFHLFIARGFAQYQPIQGQGGMIGQQSQQQLRLMSAWDTQTSYKRIRVSKRADIELTYPLIASYVEKPELAFTVDDFVVDEDSYPRRRSRRSGASETELEEPPLPVRDDAHGVIEKYVKGLGLGGITTELMLKALEWKRGHLKGEKPETPDGFYLHNRLYASTATVLLLSLCKNITTLYLGGVGYGTPLQDYLLKSNYGRLPAPGLQRVKNVEIILSSHGHSDDRTYKSLEFLDYFRYFHRLPALNTVTMEGFAEYQANRALFPSGTSSLKELHIGHTDISGGMLSTLVRMPKSLEKLSVSQGGLWSTDGGSAMISLVSLSKALLDHKDTLRVLDLDVDSTLSPSQAAGAHDGLHEQGDESRQHMIDTWGSEEEAFENEKDEYFDLDEAASTGPLWTDDIPSTRRYGYTIGSLHDLAALTHLSISARVLLGPAKAGTPPRQLFDTPPSRLVDALPPSLEFLRLYDYRRGENTDIDGHVDELLEKKEERLPRLQVIEGVDEMVVGDGSRYDERAPAEELWQRPKTDLGWVEA